MNYEPELPDLSHLVPRDIFIGGNQRHLFGKGGMGIKQIMSHLHVILEVLKRFIKIICNLKLPFGAAEYRDSLCREKRCQSPNLRLMRKEQ